MKTVACFVRSVAVCSLVFCAISLHAQPGKGGSGGNRAEQIEELLAKSAYYNAAPLLKESVQERPSDGALREKLIEVYIKARDYRNAALQAKVLYESKTPQAATIGLRYAQLLK